VWGPGVGGGGVWGWGGRGGREGVLVSYLVRRFYVWWEDGSSSCRRDGNQGVVRRKGGRVMRGVVVSSRCLRVRVDMAGFG